MKIESIEYLTKCYKEDSDILKRAELAKFAKFIFDGILSGNYAIWHNEINNIIDDYTGVVKPKKPFYDFTISPSISHYVYNQIQSDKQLKLTIHELTRKRLNEIIQFDKVQENKAIDN